MKTPTQGTRDVLVLGSRSERSGFPVPRIWSSRASLPASTRRAGLLGAQPRLAGAAERRHPGSVWRRRMLGAPEPESLGFTLLQTMAASRTRFEHANPVLRVEDMARSIRYYTEILGFTAEDWSGDDFGWVTRDGASIYLSLQDQGQPGTWVWVGVEDVASLFEE